MGARPVPWSVAVLGEAGCDSSVACKLCVGWFVSGFGMGRSGCTSLPLFGMGVGFRLAS
jgi:hypothetical protein